MEKIKKISKYVVNSLNMINFILVGLGDIFSWNIGIASKVIIFIAGAISYYLVSGKLFSLDDDVIQTTTNEDSIEELGGEVENVISNTKDITKEE